MLIFEFNADGVDEALEGFFDDFGVSVSDDNVAFAFVASRRVLTDLREFGFDDKGADFALGLFDAVNGFDAAFAHATEESGPCGVFLLWEGEGAKDHQFDPCFVEVEVVAEGGEGHDLRARGASRDFGDGDATVITEKPFHVGESGLHTEGFEGVFVGFGDLLIVGGIEFAGEQDAPLNPRILEDFEGSGIVSCRRKPHQFSVDTDAFKGVFLAFDEFFKEGGIFGGKFGDREVVVELLVVVDLEGIASASTSGGFDHDGEADLLSELTDLFGVCGEQVASAGKPVGAQDILHAGFFAEVSSDSFGHTVDTEVIADSTEGDLEIFEETDQAMDGAILLHQKAASDDDLAGIKGVVDAVVADHLVAVFLGEALDRFVGDDADADIGDLKHRLEETEGGLTEVRDDEHNVFHRGASFVLGI